MIVELTGEIWPDANKAASSGSVMKHRQAFVAARDGAQTHPCGVKETRYHASL